MSNDHAVLNRDDLALIQSSLSSALLRDSRADSDVARRMETLTFCNQSITAEG